MIDDKEVPKIEEMIVTNKQWIDRRTQIDDLLGIIAELMIENNTTQQVVLDKIAQGIEIVMQIDAVETDRDSQDEEKELIKPGDTGVSLAVCNSGNIGSFIINKTIVNGIAKNDIVAYERIIVVPGGTPDEPYVVPLSVLIKGDQGVVAQDSNNRLISAMYGDKGLISQDVNNYLISVMKGNYSGSLETVAVDSNGLMQTDVSKAEKISIIETDKDTHFTGAISQYDHEEENLTGLTDNRIFVRGVNIQSDQNLKFRLIFWTKDTFADTDLNDDSYIDDVILDMSDSENTFRINNTNQYYLNVSDLNILYEDEDATNELHISLQNLSPTDKAAGATGEVQLDIKYAPRL